MTKPNGQDTQPMLPAHPELAAKVHFDCSAQVKLRRLREPRKSWEDLSQLEREMRTEAMHMMMAHMGQGALTAWMVEAARQMVGIHDANAAKALEAQGAADALAGKAEKAGLTVIGDKEKE